MYAHALNVIANDLVELEDAPRLEKRAHRSLYALYTTEESLSEKQLVGIWNDRINTNKGRDCPCLLFGAKHKPQNTN